MKKRILFTIWSITLVLASCDSFLEIQPVGKVIPNSIEEYRALLTNAYEAVPDDRGLACFRSDEMQVRNEEYDQNAYANLERWNDSSPLTTNVSFSWAKYYQVIFIANEIINNHDKIEYTKKEEVDQLLGEAYLLRAYMHFLLVNLHGEPYTKEGALETKAIPLRLFNDLEGSIYRNTVKEVYESVLQDIKQAESHLNKTEWEKPFSYRFTKQAADALNARVALYMGNWKNAYDYSMLIVNHPLYALEDFTKEEKLLPNNYLSTESITALEQSSNSSVNRATLVPPHFLDKYKEGDLRFDLYFSDPDEEGFRNSQKGGSNQFSSTFRLAEFILTAAEASVQLDNLSESRKLLLILAEKRFTPDGYENRKKEIETLNKDDLISEILEERARELALEGHRWFDLIRTTRPKIEKVLIEGSEKKTFVLEKDDPRYTIPIPRIAIEANPNLAVD
ncbi:MAG: RagB/SusD family nutrient uptake outer membrane protein [Bacteroidales bacterium]|nr:RagB/SusD family nutrient uptake outer membrane protein [Bacteroidales bacterium]